ncbi:MAG: dihydrodipicolinate synthase family protein [Chloroflexota bacterium]
MNLADVKQVIRGPLAPVLTIYRQDDLSVDLDAIQANVDQQIRRGMSRGNGVLLAAGAGGDFPLLSLEERKAVIKAVAEAAGDRATVLGTAQSPLTQEAIELAQWSQQVGCYGIQLSPSWYYPPNDRQVYEHFKAVAESIDICIMIYHTPWLGSVMSTELFGRLWQEFSNIRSIKWAASNPAETMAGYIELSGKYAMINNGPSLLEGALLGASGFVTHLANVWPEQQVAFWKLIESGDYRQATAEYLKVQWPWRGLRSWAYTTIARGESLAVKPAAEMTGFYGGPSRPPMIDLNQEQRAHMRSVLQEMGAPLV